MVMAIGFISVRVSTSRVVMALWYGWLPDKLRSAEARKAVRSVILVGNNNTAVQPISSALFQRLPFAAVWRIHVLPVRVFKKARRWP